jgi:mannosyltransferase
MLLRPEQVHHFEDFGYRHDTLFECPANAPGGQLLSSPALGNGNYSAEVAGGIGCRCECDGRVRRNQDSYCLNRMKSPNTPRSSMFNFLS